MSIGLLGTSKTLALYAVSSRFAVTALVSRPQGHMNEIRASTHPLSVSMQITLVSSLAYLVMGLSTLPGSPLGIDDPNTIQFW